MSYSIGVNGANKAEVADQLKAKLAEVVAQRPFHAVDQEQALGAANMFVELLPDLKDGEQYNVSLSGSGWSQDDGLRSIGVNVTAGIGKIPAAA